MEKSDIDRLVLEIFQSFGVAYFFTLIVALIYRGLEISAVYKSLFILLFSIVAPVVCSFDLLHPIFAIIGYFKLFFLIVKKYRYKYRFIVLSILLLVWEYYGMYCMSNCILM